jgi:DNA invertase Pin-like site-specific DNA recombinase
LVWYNDNLLIKLEAGVKGLDPTRVGTPRDKRSVVYIRESAGNFSEQASDLWKWEEAEIDASRPAIWVREDPCLPCYDTPSLDRVSRLIAHNRIGVLAVWRLDILAKPATRCAEFITRIVNKHGCRFVSVADMIDTALPSGRLFVSQLGSLGRFAREKKAKCCDLRDGRGRVINVGPSNKTKRLAPKVERMLRNGYTRYETAKRLNISKDLVTRMINEYKLVKIDKEI